MDVHNDLRVNVRVGMDFSNSSFDDSATMSCPSFTSSSSSSRRDSIISSPLDSHYELNDYAFAGPPHLLGVDGLSAITDDEFQLPMDDPLPSSKSMSSWGTDLSGLRTPGTQSLALGPVSSFDYGHGPNEHQSIFEECLPCPVVNGLPINHSSSESPGMPFSPIRTISPSLAFGAQQEGQGYVALLYSGGQSSPLIQERFRDGLSDDKNIFWSPEGNGLTLASPSMSTIATQEFSQGTVHNPIGMSKSRRHQQKHRSTRISKENHSASIASSQHPCPHKECKAKFQRPEHLKRHLSCAKHSTTCDYLCPLCKDSQVETKGKDKGKAFNRKDNYHAHVINCHLLQSDRPRRPRITDLSEIERYGWSHLLPQKEREETKRRNKQQGRGSSKSSMQGKGVSKSHRRVCARKAVSA